MCIRDRSESREVLLAGFGLDPPQRDIEEQQFIDRVAKLRTVSVIDAVVHMCGYTEECKGMPKSKKVA
eukprot:4392578-Alexandrium_andersonii.AAC.1